MSIETKKKIQELLISAILLKMHYRFLTSLGITPIDNLLCPSQPFGKGNRGVGLDLRGTECII